MGIDWVWGHRRFNMGLVATWFIIEIFCQEIGH